MDKTIILVVSSESKNRFALMEILDREGWKTICTSTASECKEVFHNHNIHVVFCERGLSDGTYRQLIRPLVVTFALVGGTTERRGA